MEAAQSLGHGLSSSRNQVETILLRMSPEKQLVTADDQNSNHGGGCRCLQLVSGKNGHVTQASMHASHISAHVIFLRKLFSLCLCQNAPCTFLVVVQAAADQHHMAHAIIDDALHAIPDHPATISDVRGPLVGVEKVCTRPFPITVTW